mmetsp:Transcript_13194/g.38846  ORF Transcript_13194/g.38846 Transcript_13194/m.38846 type:complete len:322 (-) Transcript_13194:390-1355(-)
MNALKGVVSAITPQSVKSYALSTAEYLSPVMTESQFQEKGMLTPEEFVVAGDMLVLKCPTWEWSGGDRSKARAHLPVDKQFLVTRNVPCIRRVNDLAGAADARSGHPLEDCAVDEDGWTSTPVQSFGARDLDAGSDADIQSISGPGDAPHPPGAGHSAEAKDDIPSMADFEEENLQDAHDDAALAVGGLCLDDGAGDKNIVRSRTYDISITYDKYYRCPRVWLYGYTEAHQPLSNHQIFEDLSADHANKTCTIESHPHLERGIFASIHPCRHAEVMKKLCEQLETGGATPRADQYLFLFLKFISTMIPTIDYDYTMSFEGF